MYETFAENGIENVRLFSLSPESLNADAVVASVAEDASFWSKFKGSVFTKDFAIWAGAEAVSAGVGFLAGLGINALLHNQDEWIVMNAMMIPLGPVGAIGTAAMGIASKYGADYFKRQIERVYQTDAQENRLSYVRSVDDQGNAVWVPAIITKSGSPQEAATFMDAYGRDENWEGATYLKYQTGLGLTMTENGDFKWQVPGRSDHMIMREDDVNWGANLDDQENWKPWLQMWCPSPEMSQRLFETGMYETIPARDLNSIYSDLNASSEFRATVDLIQILHNEHIVDPHYASTLGKDYKWKDDYHDVFVDTARDDRGYSYWRNLPSASNLAWDMESANPDNFWQWKMLGKKNQSDFLITYFSNDIQKTYGKLSSYSKAELAHTKIARFPETSSDYAVYVSELGRRTDLTVESKKFLISQARAQFVGRMGSRIYPGGTGESFDTSKYGQDFELNQDMMNLYRTSEQYYVDYHPLDAIAGHMEGGPTYQALFGDAQHAQSGWYDTNAWGVYEAPDVQKGPKLHQSIKSNVRPTQYLFAKSFVGALEQNSEFFHQWGDMFHSDESTAAAVSTDSGDLPDVDQYGVGRWVYYNEDRFLNPNYTMPDTTTTATAATSVIQQATDKEQQVQTTTDPGLGKTSGGFDASQETLADAHLSAPTGGIVLS